MGALGVSPLSGATAYRCDDAGRVTYTNLPCPSGRQTELAAPGPGPSAADRAAAENRHRADEARLETIGKARERERRQDQRAAATALRRNIDRGKRDQACAKLLLRAKRAHEDFDTAGPKDQPARRVRMRRADDDYAAQCRKS